MTVKVIVCGGRNFRSPAHVFSELEYMHGIYKFTALMQGGASGVDRMARDWAATHPEIDRYVCRADWKTHGRAAGPIRNAKMLQWKPDMVIAFAGGAGTANVVAQAKKAGINVAYPHT